MNRVTWVSLLVVAGVLATASAARGQSQYIGYVYPAGGQQGTTFPVRLGGQRLTGVCDVRVSGEGVSGRVVLYYARVNNREQRLLSEQLKALTKGKDTISDAMVARMSAFTFPTPIGPKEDRTPTRKSAKPAPNKKVAKAASAKPPTKKGLAKQKLIDRIRRKISANERKPACQSIAELVFLEVTVAPDAKPGRREIRLVTRRGVSNPLPFFVGQVPEVARKAMKISKTQVLGKEYLAQRKRPPEEVEMRVTVPCTMNGQIATGEVNRYRFKAKQGQRLVISAKARALVPYVADAVPGWFQAVMTLCDASGNEVAYNDDFRSNPDPTLYVEVPKDDEYVLTISDAIYRGREDFVYRITIGELPFVTSIFPLGARAGQPPKIEMEGWNLGKAQVAAPPKDATPGTHLVAARKGKLTSNHLPFAIDTLPECLDNEPNNTQANAQKVKRPVIVNGRVDRPGDWDVFEIEGNAGATVVIEVQARRLASPLDSFIKVTDASGQVLALNDDHHDAASGLNTDHADSYLMVKLPANGKYFVHLGDTTRHGGKAYAYRLRISPPRPDFHLRVVPSRIVMASRKATAVTVYAVRKDGFDGAIKLNVKGLPKGITSSGATLPAKKDVARLTVKTTLAQTKKPVKVAVAGRARIQGKDVVHEAVAAEDAMQAFLWRHLLPADELVALVGSPYYKPPTTRKRPPISENNRPKPPEGGPQYTKQQVAGRIREIERLYQQWFLTDDFANRLIAEVEAGLQEPTLPTAKAPAAKKPATKKPGAAKPAPKKPGAPKPPAS